jgi:Uma2 family endonuclease
MAGGSPRHSLIKMNVGAVLRDRLLDRPCTPYDSDLRIRTPSGLYTYPDVSVVCGVLIFDDEHRDTVLNPTVIVEVLSPSTEAYDRGKKFEHYRRIESLREYVLVSQDSPRIEKFSRNDDGTWTLSIAGEVSETVVLDSLNVGLPLAQVFMKVDFNSEDATKNVTDPPSYRAS